MAVVRSNSAPKPVTPERLENAALYYVQRFATTRANLRRVLMRRLTREMDDDLRRALAEAIDCIVEKFAANGYVNDEVYAQSRIAALRRQGASTRAIGMKLRAKGVGRDLLQEKLSVEEDGADLEAAMAFARKRRLGPYRPPEKRAEFRQKDMAAMGRAGFDYETARAVIDAASATY